MAGGVGSRRSHAARIARRGHPERDVHAHGIMRRVRDLAARVAPVNTTVLITGEVGWEGTPRAGCIPPPRATTGRSSP